MGAEANPIRDEHEIFRELRALCTAPGYIHALTLICFRENMVAHLGEIDVESLMQLYRPERLIRTEIMTLIGLMLKESIDFTVPSRAIAEEYLDKTYELLAELHRAMSNTWKATFKADPHKVTTNNLSQGSFLREGMFYSGESAYSFQYRDIAPLKYAADNKWLEDHRGFRIEDAREILRAAQIFQSTHIADTIETLAIGNNEEWSILPGFTITATDLTPFTDVPEHTIVTVLEAFAVVPDERNGSFDSMHDFNVATAAPLLRDAGGRFILLDQYSFAQALYEGPFYWMGSDKSYVSTAMEHRGQFTEAFTRSRLELVFGRKAVFSNVTAWKDKAEAAGEIDTLVIFGDRAIVLQAKSKRLTLEARRGNDLQIRSDFQKSVQDSYDQGLSCAKILLDHALELRDSSGTPTAIPVALKEIYILCVVSDHYPALSFQARQFLRAEVSDKIPAPFVLDVFTIDTMTELLDSPLQFLSYMARRTGYADKIAASHELVVLAFHLKHNLWLDAETDRLMLCDDFSADLDVVMTVRREGMAGKRTIEGPITHLAATTLGKLVKSIERLPKAQTLDLGFSLLTLSGKTVTNISQQIDRLIKMTQLDRSSHDISMPMGGSGEGLTIHCNAYPAPLAADKLKNHCRLRKYKCKAKRWFGLCLHPNDGSIRFGINLEYPWERSDEMDSEVSTNLHSGTTIDMSNGGRKVAKIGRNDPCPCGSKKKFKRCCLD